MTSRAGLLDGLRVLLVEDDYFIATALQVLLEEGNALVLGPVPSVEEALELVAATPDIDAAVLDVKLRDDHVFPVADLLRARGVRFLFATGYEKAMIPPQFADVPHCEKPIQPAQIVALLHA